MAKKEILVGYGVDLSLIHIFYATGQLRIASDNFTGLTEKMQQAADQVEEGVAIIAREGASAKMCIRDSA